MQWYYADNGNQQVEVQEAELPQLVVTGKINASTLVWNSSMSDWQPANNALPQLFGGATAAASSTTPSVAGSSPYSPPTAAQNRTVAVEQPNPTHGLQIASLVCGILSIMCFGPLTGIPAVICGHIARSKHMALTQSKEGTGMALAGLILGYLGIVITIISVALSLSGVFDAYQYQ